MSWGVFKTFARNLNKRVVRAEFFCFFTRHTRHKFSAGRSLLRSLPWPWKWAPSRGAHSVPSDLEHVLWHSNVADAALLAIVSHTSLMQL